MSIHAIEDLVECSVRTIAAADPAPANARDLCYGLYELQDQFDCKYTVLRVPAELERLGYLRRLTAQQLPQPEQAEVLALSGESGFIGGYPGCYFDAASGQCCVTAGSPLWEKLCQSGVLTGPDAVPVRVIPMLELAEQIVEPASVQKSEAAAQTMGLWYALFPAFLPLDLEDEDEELSTRMLTLRDRLAAPEALSFAVSQGLPPPVDELGQCDRFEAQWLEPYAAMEKNPQARMQRVMETLQRGDFSAARALADELPGETERIYFQSLISLFYHQMLAAGNGSAPFEGLIPLEAVCDGFASLLGRQLEIDCLCNVNRAAALSLLGEHWKAFEVLQEAFEPAFEKLQKTEDDWSRRFGEAALAVTFYRTIESSTPDSAPEKRQMLTTRAGRIPTIQEARDVLTSLPQERTDQEWACRYQIGVCWLIEGETESARRELEEAERLHPGDPEVKAALIAACGG